MAGRETVIEDCQREGIELLRLLHVDSGGVVRGRVVDADDAADVLGGGTNTAKVTQVFTPFNAPAPESPYGPVGEARLVPDPGTFRTLPYAEGTAVMLCDKYTSGGDRMMADPRTRLGEFLEGFEYTPSSAFESEFYLAREGERGIEPLDETGCFTADGMQRAHDVVLEMVRALKRQDMSFDAYYPELGPGQQELVVGHDRGMCAPDNQVLYRQTVKAVAREHGLTATFAPKPFPDAPGTGCHIHLSLWDGDENRFFDSDSDDEFGITEECRHFVGGLLEHGRALVALTAPTVISYKRLQPHSWASAYTVWGLDNREAMVRVPSSQWEDPASTTRIELKASDNASNPYLALLGVLAAGTDGIERELDPGDPVDRDPGTFSEREREERGIERLPESLGEAIEELEADEVLREALGEELVEGFLAVKRAEWNEATNTTTDWDVERYTRSF
jgi:glutamine synthetase